MSIVIIAKYMEKTSQHVGHQKSYLNAVLRAKESVRHVRYMQQPRKTLIYCPLVRLDELLSCH